MTSYQKLVVDASTGEATVQDLSPAEVSNLQALQTTNAQQNAAFAQTQANQRSAVAQLKAKAKTDQNAALYLQAIGIDPNAS